MNKAHTEVFNKKSTKYVVISIFIVFDVLKEKFMMFDLIRIKYDKKA